MTAPHRTPADLVSVLRADADQAPEVDDFLDRHPIQKRTGVGSRRTALSIAAVIVVMVALAVTLPQRTVHPPASASTSHAAAVAGRSWALVRIGGAHGSVDLVRDHPDVVGLGPNDVWISFGNRGAYEASNGVNYLNGTYSTGRHGLTLRFSFTTLVSESPAGDWPDVVRAAMRHLTGQDLPTRGEGVTVAAQLSRDRLVLSIDGYVLTFEQAAPPETTQTYAGLTLRFPTTWHAVPVTFNSAGVVIPLGYITTQTPGAECRARTPGAQLSCGPPISDLQPGGVLITIQDAPDTAASATPSATIAGLPATLTDTSGCSAGADRGRMATIHVPPQGGSGRLIIISACTRTPTSPTTDAAITRLFTTATYRKPSATAPVTHATATVHGQVHLIGGVYAGTPRIGHGDVLVYPTERRLGQPLITSHLDATGSYSFTIRPGTYWLSTTAAIYNNNPCADAPTLTVHANDTVRRDIICHIK